MPGTVFQQAVYDSKGLKLGREMNENTTSPSPSAPTSSNTFE
jgi:hypothetical protein